ncbi:uncharacterized protein LOC135393396 [Ornithodoros turicata]|uniref:uncharacterized protein LOC135393396 n=1 Tax=Ornithodoros turicata TaxID=34597 RepID=UPI00313A1426
MMYLKPLALALCFIGCQYAPAKGGGVATENRDIFKTLNRTRVYFLVRRTYQRPGGRSECAYRRILQTNADHSILMMMGERDKKGAYNKDKVYVTTRLGRNDERNHMRVSYTGYKDRGVEYKMIYDDADGCSIFKVITDEREGPRLEAGECEMWAAKKVAIKIRSISACEVAYSTLCKPDTKKEDTPYLSTCTDPPARL